MLEKKQTKKIEEILTEIDLEQPAPAEEPMRQYYFMEKARTYSSEKIPGRKLQIHNKDCLPKPIKINFRSIFSQKAPSLSAGLFDSYR